MKNRFSIQLLTFTCLSTLVAQADPKPLPSPAEFEPERYLGKWFEVARLPISSQPEGSLAIAEYLAGDAAGTVKVKNSAYDADGEFIGSIEGTAEIVEGEAKGRLKVGFGPNVPQQANYCVLSVHPKYRFALVGSPDRNSMWILSRKPSLGKKRLEKLVSVAEEAGFDTSKLVINQWPKKFAKAAGDSEGKTAPALAGKWIFRIDGPDGEVVALPLELELDGEVLSGRISRGDGRWLALKDGTVDGDSFRFLIERDRSDGSSMVYEITGKHAGNELSGEAKTEVDGQKVSRDWDAVRVVEEAVKEEIKKTDIAGEWILRLPGPDGQIVDLPMELEVDGTTLSGRISRGDGRWLTVKDGKLDGDSFNFAVERDRADGDSITYEMAGKFADGNLSGTTKANFEGRGEITSKWEAVRKE